MDTTQTVALIAGGSALLGALGGAGLTVLGNIVVGRMNRTTQREQLQVAQIAASQADQRALRDGAAGRLRQAYANLIEAAIEYGHTRGEDRSSSPKLAKVLEREGTAVSLEPHGEEAFREIGSSAVSLRTCWRPPQPISWR